MICLTAVERLFVEQGSGNSLVTVATREELENVEEEIQNIEVTRFDKNENSVHVQRSNDILVHSVFMAELSVLRTDTTLNIIHKVEREDCDLQHNTSISSPLRYMHTNGEGRV